jgi:hypothetical protein
VTAIAILRESDAADSETRYRAIAPNRTDQSLGRTAGEALDALTALLEPADAGTLVVVQQMQPDQFFTALQISRLQELMNRHRDAAEASEAALSPAEEAELRALIDAELLASTSRSAALADALGR